MALLRGFREHQPALVKPAGRAGVVGQARFVALGAEGEIGRRQVLVGAPHVLFGDGFFTFG